MKIRYKQPGQTNSHEFAVSVVPDVRPVSRNFQLAAAAAMFGMELGRSPYKGDSSLDAARRLAKAAAKSHDENGYVKELTQLIEQANKLQDSLADVPPRDGGGLRFK